MHWQWVRIGSAVLALVAPIIVLTLIGSRYDLATAGVILAALAIVTQVAVSLAQIALTRAAPDCQLLTSRLSGIVYQQWDAEATIRQLRDPQPLMVRWTDAPRALQDHSEATLGPGGSNHRISVAGNLNQVVERFMGIPTRRLVVIGEPGSGKTGIVILLALRLIERLRPHDPVPVIFSLSTWNTSLLSVREWLTLRLSAEYPIRRADAVALLDAQMVLPIMDGLDEVADPASVIEAINRADLRMPFVVACRADEYRETVRRAAVVRGAAVARVEPMAPHDVREYLRAASGDSTADRWNPVFAQLDRGTATPIARAMSTPLMVSLARRIYTADGLNADPGKLIRFSTPTDIENHLLDELVPTVFGAAYNRDNADWPDSRTASAERWLKFLAALLQERGQRDLAWWQFGPSTQPALALRGVAIAFASSLIVESVFVIGFTAIMSLVMRQLLNPLGSSLFISLYGGLAFGTCIGVGLGAVVTLSAIYARNRTARLLLWFGNALSSRHARLAPARLALRIDQYLLTRIARCVLFGVSAGVIFGIFGGRDGLLVGVVDGSGMGLTLGLVMGLVRQSDEPPDPMATICSDRAVSMLSLGLGGAGLGMATALAVGIVVRLDGSYSALVAAFATGIVAGLGIALPSGLGFTEPRPWPDYQVCRAWLAVRSRIPWRLMGFLEESYRLGVLRKVGSSYQFRHARLQDRLAEQIPDSPMS